MDNASFDAQPHTGSAIGSSEKRQPPSGRQAGSTRSQSRSQSRDSRSRSRSRDGWKREARQITQRVNQLESVLMRIAQQELAFKTESRSVDSMERRHERAVGTERTNPAESTAANNAVAGGTSTASKPVDFFLDHLGRCNDSVPFENLRRQGVMEYPREGYGPGENHPPDCACPACDL